MSSRMWTGFSRCSVGARKTAPHPIPLPASGAREIITLSGPGLYEKSGLMSWRRRFDDIRQRVEQICYLERLAEARPIGVLARQYVIAGDKDKGNIALGQYLCHRINSLA